MQKPFILIIEDERDIAALFRHVMDLAGYRTEICTNGKLALEALAASRPDVVLLDLSLPGVSGVNILQQMRADERLRRIPVVVVTAYSELAESMAVEPDLVMLKPVSAVQLTHLVQRLTLQSKNLETAPLDLPPWDDVTGVYNRSFFLNRLDGALSGAKTGSQSLFAVLALSPDRYELINHEYGTRQANEFISALAEVLRGSIRPTDTIARFDGDHFFLLIEQAPGLHIPEMIAARIQGRLKDRPLGASGSRFPCCIGVLLCDARYGNVEDVLRDARLAYEQARLAGPGACLTFDRDSILLHTRPA
jgi:diguanylate cyclase (GGDEF)-like protein